MSQANKTGKESDPASAHSQSRWAIPLILVVVAGMALAVFMLKNSNSTPGAIQAPTPISAQPNIVEDPNHPAPSTQTLTMSVAQAVMVTAELKFPSGMPSIAEALSQIERRYEPQDGMGRTFAILDAYGEPTPDGKLHISMHVSSEKPGTGSLVFKPTREVLWRSQITPAGNPPAARNLTIYVADQVGAAWIVDGSGNPSSVLEAKVRDKQIPVRDFWPDGAEREVTFVYSACGCPVKTMVRRVGDRTVRTSDVPVIFPDDPAAVQVISRLMRW